jgi:preprotein translocase subunit SecE
VRCWWAGAGRGGVFATSESGKAACCLWPRCLARSQEGGLAHPQGSHADDGYVFAFVVVMALFLWLTDKTLEWVFYDLILGWRNK